MYWLSPFFYMEATFWSLEKKVKTFAITRDEIFQNSRAHTSFNYKITGEFFWRVESRDSWRETEEMQIKLTATCEKNEQQDAKNNAEL
jgi:hypothetical protein